MQQPHLLKKPKLYLRSYSTPSDVEYMEQQAQVGEAISSQIYSTIALLR